MMAINLPLALEKLVPNAEYLGSLTDGSKESFDNLRWHDERPKPSWEDVQDAWGLLEPVLNSPPIDQQAKDAIDLLPAETRAYHYEHITKIRSALKEKDFEVIPYLLQQVQPRNEQEGQALQQLAGILNGTS